MKSYWRLEGDKCNKCGQVVEENEEAIKKTFTGGVVVRKWSSKFHRYLTEGQIKSGERGG